MCVWKNENNEKEAGVGLFFIKKIFPFEAATAKNDGFVYYK